jgi:hypothetical protein
MKTITQEDIDRINALHRGISRASNRILRDALEIGDFFLFARENFISPCERKGKIRAIGWPKWLEVKFPDIGNGTIYRYMRLAEHRGLLEKFGDSTEFPMREAIRLIQFHERMDKEKGSKSLASDAHPLELLKTKLSGYVVGLWALRHLEAEIFGLFSTMELSNEEIQRALNHVCQQHLEVKDEVMKTFSPFPRLGSKSA